MALLETDDRRWKHRQPITFPGYSVRHGGGADRPNRASSNESDADGQVPPSLLQWTPLAGTALLDRIRITGRPRPAADPNRVEALRRIIDDGIESCLTPVAVSGADRRRLVVTHAALSRALDRRSARSDGSIAGRRELTVPIACGALVGVLFRQLLTTGSFGDPWVDGLGALAVDDRQQELVAWIHRLPAGERDGLAAEVRRQAAGLARRWPDLDAAWLPRTDEPIRTVLSDGAVELSARVDLAIGRPGLDVASVALVAITSGSRRPAHRDDLHFSALVETLRRPAPPFAVATYYSRTGELDVDPVSDELLIAAAERTAAGISAMVRQEEP